MGFDHLIKWLPLNEFFSVKTMIPILGALQLKCHSVEFSLAKKTLSINSLIERKLIFTRQIKIHFLKLPRRMITIT